MRNQARVLCCNNPSRLDETERQVYRIERVEGVLGQFLLRVDIEDKESTPFRNGHLPIDEQRLPLLASGEPGSYGSS